MDCELPDDTILLQRIKLDDTLAFKILFDRYWQPLYLFAWKRLKLKQDAEDVVQHVFMKLWEHRLAKNINFSLKAYLYKSVSYEVIETLKKLAASTEDITAVNEYILPAFDEVLSRLDTKELNALIEEEIIKLPERMQLVYRLSRENGMPLKDIATQLGISEQTVKNQLSIALSRLRKPILQTLFIFLLEQVTIW